jgi:benzoylformate decarboxylase
MSGKRAFLELLKQEGVEILFGNPGTTELPLMDALAVENELRYVLALQEASVIGMADGYAQASGKLAVVNLHVTPGLGNAMGMLYDAQKAGSPILVTAGQHDQDIAPLKPHWRRRPARYSCRCRATFSKPRATSICWRRPASRRSSAAIRLR